MKEIDLKQIKSMEELKKELGNKYDEVMYKMNLELFDRMDRTVEDINRMQEIIRQQPSEDSDTDEWIINRLNGLLYIIKGSDKE